LADFAPADFGPEDFGPAVRGLDFARAGARPPPGSPAYGFEPDFTVMRIGVPGRSKLWRIELIR
jgi:hypothetical protein